MNSLRRIVFNPDRGTSKAAGFIKTLHETVTAANCISLGDFRHYPIAITSDR